MSEKRNRAGFRALLVALTLTALAGAAPAATQEEPDAATQERVIAAIEDYVRQDVELKETFLIVDPRSGEPLKLAYDHVHEGIHPEGEGAWRACVDFTDAAGTLYDVDVVVELGERAEIDRVFVHKVDGEAIEGGQ